MVCKNCGKLASKGQKFCSICGMELPKETIVSSIKSKISKEEDKVFIYCPKCGKKAAEIKKDVEGNNQKKKRTSQKVNPPKNRIDKGYGICYACGHKWTLAEKDKQKEEGLLKKYILFPLMTVILISILVLSGQNGRNDNSSSSKEELKNTSAYIEDTSQVSASEEINEQNDVPTVTPTVKAQITATPKTTSTPTPKPTTTVTPTPEPTLIPTSSPTPTATATPNPTPEPTIVPSPAPTAEPAQEAVPSSESNSSFVVNGVGDSPAQSEQVTRSQSGSSGVTIPAPETEGNLVWIPVNGGKKYHSNSSCSNMENPIQVSKETAEANGFTPCKRCH